MLAKSDVFYDCASDTIKWRKSVEYLWWGTSMPKLDHKLYEENGDSINVWLL